MLQETLAELASGNYPKKAEVIQFLARIPVLPAEPQIMQIAQIYLDNYGYVSIVCCCIINHRYYSTMEHKYERIKV